MDVGDYVLKICDTHMLLYIITSNLSENTTERKYVSAIMKILQIIQIKIKVEVT